MPKYIEEIIPEYADAVRYLNSFINFETLPDQKFDTRSEDLDRFRLLLKQLGAPQNNYPIIHVAGTKGKGSVATLIASILFEAGYKVGLYTSPHLVTVRERISIARSLTPKIKFSNLIEQVRTASIANGGGTQSFRTVFEHLTAAALYGFAMRPKCQVAVVEAGLGGKLDATVVLNPILSVITPIGLDHTAILGNTIGEIAADKAHVIKPKVPVVIAQQKDEASEILLNYAKEKDSPVFPALSVEEEFSSIVGSLKWNTMISKRKWLENVKLNTHLLGTFQNSNIATVLQAVEVLRNMGFRISPSHVAKGINPPRFNGRLKLVNTNPNILLDSGHNDLAIQAVKESLQKMEIGSLRVVISALRGKPIAKMLSILGDITQKFYIAPIRFPKALTQAELRSAAVEAGVKAEFYQDVPTAFMYARAETKQGETLLATGSFYQTGEILRYLQQLPPPPEDGSIDHRV